jgi:glycosyltransferase involved in cell wall biosynthesis
VVAQRDHPPYNTPVADRPITVTYVVDDLAFGGAQKQLDLLMQSFGGAVKPVACCLSNATHPFGDAMRRRGVPVHVIRRRMRWDPTIPSQIARVLYGARADIVHGWLDAANAWAFLASRRVGIPAVLSLQSDRLRMKGLRARMLSAMLRRAAAVTVNSVSGRDFLTGRVGVPGEKVVLVPNWVAAPEVPAGNGSGETVVGFVGRLVALKRVDRLLDGFAILHRERPGARLVVVGDGPERSALVERAQALGLGEAVSFPGNVIDIGVEMSRFDCLVIPSEFEGLPNVALEAFAAGIPVVARPVGDLRTLVRDAETGRLVEGDSPGDLAGAIAAVLDDATLRARARVAGPALTVERFSISRAVDAYVGLYRALVGAKKRGR